MARLLEDLLDVSRISRRKLDLRRKTLDLAAVLEAAVETSRPAIDAGHHRLVVDVAPRTFFVSGDAVRLAQVFANLIHNAAKYTPDRGQIVVFAQARGDHVVISVSDDGMGIEQALLEKVFEMFAQGPAPAHRGGGGLGIGLSLVKGIVELHGGSVEARSDGANRGSEFRVILPRAAPEVAEAIVPTAHAPRTHASRRVLVVDDNVDNADMLAALFEAYGHVSKALYSSSVALAEAAAFRPDVVLLDIGMPELDGHELCRRLRALPECGSALFIAMSGWGRPEDRVRSREAGFAHHEVKPLDPAALVRLLSTA
jgi:CheY-like chemotaxis protein/two-component sensor histidine kinase